MLLVEQFLAPHGTPPALPTSQPHTRKPSVTEGPTTVEFDAELELGELERAEGITFDAGTGANANGRKKHRRSSSISGEGKASAVPLTLGLVVHALADGLALGSSALSDAAEAGGASGSQGVGSVVPSSLSIVVFLALVIHKGALCILRWALLRCELITPSFHLISRHALTSDAHFCHRPLPTRAHTRSLTLTHLRFARRKCIRHWMGCGTAPTALALTTSLLSTPLSRADCKKHIAAFSLSTPLGALASYALLSWFEYAGAGRVPGIAMLVSVSYALPLILRTAHGYTHPHARVAARRPHFALLVLLPNPYAAICGAWLFRAGLSSTSPLSCAPSLVTGMQERKTWAQILDLRRARSSRSSGCSSPSPSVHSSGTITGMAHSRVWCIAPRIWMSCWALRSDRHPLPRMRCLLRVYLSPACWRQRGSGLQAWRSAAAVPAVLV